MDNKDKFFQIIQESSQVMKQKCKMLQSVKQLHQLYPDIQEQLCSRHSTLFGKLKSTFNKLYDRMQPEYYVVVKGNCEFVQEQLTDIRLSMGLENGVVLMVAKTYPQAEIFVNSNHFGEEVIFSHRGQLQQGLNTMSTQIQSVIKTATANLNPLELNGGVLYIHSNIPEHQFNYKESLLTAVYLAVMTINDNLKNFNTHQMVKKLSALGFLGSKQQIERIFHGYHNRKFNLTLPDLLSIKDRSSKTIELDQGSNIIMEQGLQDMITNKKQSCQLRAEKSIVQKSHLLLKMDKNFKMLFCKLDLAKQDVNYEFQRRREIETRKNQLLDELKLSHNISGLFELFYKLQQIDLEALQFESQYQKSCQPKSIEELESLDQNEILRHSSRLLRCLLAQIEIVSDFSNDKVSLKDLVDQIWRINSQHLKLHCEQVVDLVQDMKQALELQGCMIVNQDFLLIVVHKNNFTELLCQVKHKMNKGELKSKSLFKIEDQQLVLQRWSSDKAIGQKLFSSVPAQGIGIFDPTDAIWFD